jgi:hypothetical protein
LFFSQAARLASLAALPADHMMPFGDNEPFTRSRDVGGTTTRRQQCVQSA